MATCYVDGSRGDGQTCTADVQCSSKSCNTTAGKCRTLTGTCDPAVGCAPGPVGDPQTCVQQSDGSWSCGPSNPPPSPFTSVTLSVTTSSYGGKFAPSNVGAIWVETPSGQFVKTLTEWGLFRQSNLVKWMADANGSTVDAITSATSYSAGQHTGKWDGTDVNGQVVADGSYQFIVEFTEDDSTLSFVPAGPWTAVPFTKGPGKQNFTVPDTQFFHDMSVSYQ